MSINYCRGGGAMNHPSRETCRNCAGMCPEVAAPAGFAPKLMIGLIVKGLETDTPLDEKYFQKK